MAPFVEAVQQALLADARRPAKERRTAKALHAQLAEAGFTLTLLESLLLFEVPNPVVGKLEKAPLPLLVTESKLLGDAVQLLGDFTEDQPLHRAAVAHCTGREAQGPHPRQGRAPVSRALAAVQLHQGAPPGAGQEHGADRHAVCARQPVDGAAQADGCWMSKSACGRRGLGDCSGWRL